MPDTLSALMLRVQGGDQAAFTMLVRALEGPGLRLADRTLHDRAAAEDVVQTALSRLWTMADRFDAGRGSVSSWYRRMIVNLCLDRHRARRPMVAIEEATELPSQAASPEAEAIDNDQKRRLMAAMAQLAPRQRAALAMFHGEGLSVAEIAAALEATPKAIEGLLGRARMEIKALIMAQEEETQ
ncbi:sigma-70 family RNA polymerase sigma factor [Polymorphobacter multimanifer]|uniref:RNA polymerase sigma-70 factor (ECF subfamily) n=1 Tax=Polymorphobacter multimanifer TaxID=1070431 RepID=A0A841L153_9SPHN|nr:sigma-70 family RNA polymerase sigma factor [Polymorphobacter multimanifer]MBB6226549.1 RNA polymerase sigma-70 factor (ECF subfamily) [Polymorphobacter multimanifer]